MPPRFWTYPALCLALAVSPCLADDDKPAAGAAAKQPRKWAKLTVPVGVMPSVLMQLLDEAPSDSTPEGVFFLRPVPYVVTHGIETAVSSDADESLIVGGTPEGIERLRAAIQALGTDAKVSLRLAVQVVPVLRPGTGEARPRLSPHLPTRPTGAGEGLGSSEGAGTRDTEPAEASLIEPELRSARTVAAKGLVPGRLAFADSQTYAVGQLSRISRPTAEGFVFFPHGAPDGRPSCRVEIRLRSPAPEGAPPHAVRQRAMVRTLRGLTTGRTEYLVFPTEDPSDPVEFYVVGVTPE